MEKWCNACGNYKDVKNFYVYKSGRLQSICKKCCAKVSKSYRRSLIGFLTVSYSAKKTTSKKRGHPPPSFSKQDFIDTAINDSVFMNLWQQYVASNYSRDLAPSFDRKDNSKGYSWDNLRAWTTWRDNNNIAHEDVRKGRLDSGNFKRVPIVQMDKHNNVLKEYISIHEADRDTGVDFRNIWKCCNNQIKTSGGFKWKYKKKLKE